MKKDIKEIEIRVEESADIRSYMINSDKIKNVLNFKFKRSVEDAINDLCDAFDSEIIKDSFSDKWSNIKVLSEMQKKGKLI